MHASARKAVVDGAALLESLQRSDALVLAGLAIFDRLRGGRLGVLAMPKTTVGRKKDAKESAAGRKVSVAGRAMAYIGNPLLAILAARAMSAESPKSKKKVQK